VAPPPLSLLTALELMQLQQVQANQIQDPPVEEGSTWASWLNETCMQPWMGKKGRERVQFRRAEQKCIKQAGPVRGSLGQYRQKGPYPRRLRAVKGKSLVQGLQTVLIMLAVSAAVVGSSAISLATPTLPAAPAVFMLRQHVASGDKQIPQPETGRRWDRSVIMEAPDGVSTRVPDSRFRPDPEHKWILGMHPGQTEAELARFQAMLVANKEAFAQSVEGMPGYSGTEGPQAIVFSTDEAIFSPARKLSPIEKAVQDQKCGELLRAGFIEECPPGRHKYAACPVMPVKKDAEGNLTERRFTVDFRGGNKVTVPDLYRMPTPDDIFSKIGDSPYLSCFDLRQSFHQIPVEEADRDKLSFHWGPKLFRYCVVPMGARNSTAKLQRVIDTELRKAGLTHCAAAYVDDIIVWSSSAAEHHEHVEGILKMLLSCGLRAHPQKSLLCADVMEFIGVNVGPFGLSPCEAKVAAVRALPHPTCVKELQAVLGFLNWYRGWVPSFSTLAKPMTQLLVLGEPWVWGPAQRQAFDAIRDEMCTEGRALKRLNPFKHMTVYTDWSAKGIGAVLAQEDDDGREYMVACISRSLNVHEKLYASYKGEMLGMVWAIKSLRPWLHGASFTLVTDHKPLLWLMSSSHLTGQYARWALALQEFDFDVIHRAGVDHTNVDVLSRMPLPTDADYTGARLDDEGQPGPRPPKVSFPDGDAPPPGSLPWEPPMTAAAKKGKKAAKSARVLVTMQRALEEPKRLMESTTGAELGAEGPGDYRDAYSHARLLQDVVSGSFISKARARGIILYEPFGGMCSGLEMCLDAGIPIKRYVYSDTAEAAQKVAKFRVQQLHYRHPELLPRSATAGMWDLGHDVTQVTGEALEAVVRSHPDSRWLVIGGFECQDMSSAGQGRGLYGRRSGTFQHLLRILQGLHQQLPRDHLGYVVENTAAQHNWKHEEIRKKDFPYICTELGMPVCMDAAQHGSYAHRLRNFWTNLADTSVMREQAAQVVRNPQRMVQDILREGVTAQTSTHTDSRPMYRCNRAGHEMRAFPTLMSKIGSYAFRDGNVGMVRDSSIEGGYRELDIEERERVLGYAVGSTAAPGVTTAERHVITGGCMDNYCMRAFWGICEASAGIAGIPQAPAAHHPLVLALSTMVQREESPVEACKRLAEAAEITERGVGDIWYDTPVLDTLFGGHLPPNLSSKEAYRVSRRAKGFAIMKGGGPATQLPQLVRRMGDGTTRVVPRPENRTAVVVQTHEQAGHFGQRRTRHLVGLSFWWVGMRNTVQEVVRACQSCDRVKAAFKQPSLVLHPLAIEGLFYRWGVDLCGPFDRTGRGNEMVMVCVEHYSKWVELIPIPDKCASTCATAFRHAVLGRFGACAEVVTDQGKEWLGEFASLMSDSLIDHRTTSASRPQSNGLAERGVQTIKNSLRTAVQASQKLGVWDDELPYIQLGYNSAAQAAGGISPMQLLYGRSPTLPPATRERLERPLMFEGGGQEVQKAFADRVAAIKQAGIMVGENLRIAQHRDTLRYAVLRSGEYMPRLRKFDVGDFVYVRHNDASRRNLDTYTQPDVRRVEKIGLEGTLSVRSSDGALSSIHSSNAAPCHTPAGLWSYDARGERPSKQLACVGCQRADAEDRMLLCDSCGVGWHMHCLQTPLTEIPEGDWQCASCVRKGTRVHSGDVVWASKAQTDAARRLQHTQEGLTGRYYKADYPAVGKKGRPAPVGQMVTWWGIVQYRGPAKDMQASHSMMVVWENGQHETMTYKAVQKGLQSKKTVWPEGKPKPDLPGIGV